MVFQQDFTARTSGWVLVLRVYLYLVEVLPEVLRHQSECGEEGPAEGVKAGVAEVGVLAETLKK